MCSLKNISRPIHSSRRCYAIIQNTSSLNKNQIKTSVMGCNVLSTREVDAMTPSLCLQKSLSKEFNSSANKYSFIRLRVPETRT